MRKKLIRFSLLIAITALTGLGVHIASAQSPENRPLAPQAKPLTMPVMPTMPQKPVMAAPPVLAKPGTGNLTQQKMQPNAAGSSGQQKHPMIETETEPSPKKPEAESVKGPSGTRSPLKHPTIETEKEPSQKKPEVKSVKEPSGTSNQPKHPSMDSEKEPARNKPTVETVQEPSNEPPSQRMPTAEVTVATTKGTLIKTLTIRSPSGQVLQVSTPPNEQSIFTPFPSVSDLAATAKDFPDPSAKQQIDAEIRNAMAGMLAQPGPQPSSSAGPEAQACVNACVQGVTQCLATAAVDGAQATFSPPTWPPAEVNYHYPPPADGSNTCNSAAGMMAPYQWVFAQIEQCKNAAEACLSQCGGAADSTGTIAGLMALFNNN